jgi:glycosyltransferase involved in cell wall biosynthesis
LVPSAITQTFSLEKNMGKKKVTVVIACYNEEQNVVPLSAAIENVFQTKLPECDFEIMFIDNDSTDKTRELLAGLCEKDKKIKAIFNAKNFGHIRSPYHALTQAKGDCVMLMCADFQDPPELIPDFVHKWEQGYKVVVGVKTKSKTNPFVNSIRNLYYAIIHRFSSVEQIENFTGFGLYDQSFIKVLADLDDPYPYMRGIVAELGPRRAVIEYTQPKRRAGKSKNNFWTLYDMAMVGFTSYTSVFVRMPAFVGEFFCSASAIGFIVYLVFLCINWNGVHPSILYPILTSIFFVGGLILFFLSMIGEYAYETNIRVMKRPLVVEEKRLNFDEDENKDQKESVK